MQILFGIEDSNVSFPGFALQLSSSFGESSK